MPDVEGQVEDLKGNGSMKVRFSRWLGRNGVDYDFVRNP
jgi:hypothetical protein